MTEPRSGRSMCLTWGGAPAPFDGGAPSRPPAELALGPSPFAKTTWAEVRLDRPALVGLKIYDAGGRRVRTLLRERLSAGLHRVSWDGRDDSGRPVASGVYFLRFEEDGRSVTRHVVLMR